VIDRRDFLRLGVSAAAAAAMRRLASQSKPAGLESVTLGATGRVVPRLGIGCYPISTVRDEEKAVAVLRQAFSLGVRYVDTAPSYGAGLSESRIGKALAGLPRGELFLATKTLHRDADGARRDLEASLKRLAVEYVDSVQVHEVHDDVDLLFGKGAVLKALEKARDEGLLRSIGVTGHRNPTYLVQAVRRYPFATALVPVNPVDPQHLSFVRDFLPVAKERGVAVIAMKIFAGGSLVRSGGLTAADCLRYALAQDVAVVVPGCETVEEVDVAHSVARGYEKPSGDWLQGVERRAGSHAGKPTEWYKD
jgi:diketogulonate reductase-like aldo/keto reductase